MNRLKTVLKDRSGQGTPMILAVVVCCLILACVVFEYMRLMIVAQGVRDSVQSAIVAVATENWDEAYPGLREGYSGGYQLSGSSWTQNVTTGNVYDRLQQVLGLVYEDGRYLKYAGRIWNTAFTICTWNWKMPRLPPPRRRGLRSSM